ncbi:MAG: polysaccharide deacetylase family protein [Inhella sp.]
MRLAVLLAGLSLALCGLPGWAAAPAPLRFLLSFDDGPSAAPGPDNPTEQVLRTLANNPIQPGIKAIFFVQTRNSRAGASARGKALMRRQVDEGHSLAFHTATVGHSSHRRMAPPELAQTLADGVADLQALGGAAPRFVRPPGWAYNAATLAAYQQAGLQMLLTDLTATDGKIVWPNYSPRRRSHLRHQLRLLAQAPERLPEVEGVRPVLVTFHDPNPFTAAHLEEYLQILLEESEAVGLLVDVAQPFYAERTELERAASARAVTRAEPLQHVATTWSSWPETLFGILRRSRTVPPLLQTEHPP